MMGKAFSFEVFFLRFIILVVFLSFIYIRYIFFLFWGVFVKVVLVLEVFLINNFLNRSFFVWSSLLMYLSYSMLLGVVFCILVVFGWFWVFFFIVCGILVILFSIFFYDCFIYNIKIILVFKVVLKIMWD